MAIQVDRIGNSEIVVGDSTSLQGAFPASGGFAYSNGQYSVDFNQMPTNKFEALLKSIKVPIWLTANTNFYVRVDGNDNNDGLANTPARAFKSIQAALNYVSANYNLGVYTATINVAEGTYTGNINLPKYNSSSGRINVVSVDRTSTIIIGSIVGVPSAGLYTFAEFTFRNRGDTSSPGSSSNFYSINITDGITLYLTNCIIDIVSRTDTRAATVLHAQGGNIRINSTTIGDPGLTINTTASSNISFIFYALRSGVILISADIVIKDGTIASNVARAQRSGIVEVGIPSGWPKPNVTGNVTGVRYYATENGMIASNLSGPNYFPGTIAGSVANGGIYT